MAAHRALTPEILVQIRFPQPKISGGSSKKFNIMQIIKTVSCFAIIALVLLVSVTVPVKAASWTSLRLVDYLDMDYYEGNYKVVRYDFKRTPYIRLQFNGGSYTSNGSIGIGPSGDYSTYQYTVYPLGASTTGGPPLSNSASGGIAIDVSDLKPDASLTVSTALFLDLRFDVWTTALNVDEHYSITTTFTLAGYNSSGGYLGTIETSASTTYGAIQDIQNEPAQTIEIPFSAHLSTDGFEEPVAYIVPVCNIVFAFTDNDTDITLTYLHLKPYDFTFYVRTDMLLKNSLTMQSVENYLADLNDKTDIIINGTDEQRQEAEKSLLDSINKKQDVDDVLKDMDSMMNYDISSFSSTVTNFLETDGWTDVNFLLAPLFKWEYTSEILLIVVAFAAISIILFGR